MPEPAFTLPGIRVHLPRNRCSRSPESVFTMLWNGCSPSAGICVHDAPEYAARVVNPPETALIVTHCRKRLYVSSADVSLTGTPFRLSQSAGSSGGEWSFRFLAGNYQKEGKTSHLNGQFGAILGLIGPFFHLIAQTMRRRSTPRSSLRRRRIAEFELAKPRIHPAELYGGNEDDSADGPVQGAIRVWKP